MQTDATGRAIYPKIGLWYREDPVHIPMSIDGHGFSTVNINPVSMRGNPHLYAKLAKIFGDGGSDHPPIQETSDA